MGAPSRARWRWVLTVSFRSLCRNLYPEDAFSTCCRAVHVYLFSAASSLHTIHASPWTRMSRTDSNSARCLRSCEDDMHREAYGLYPRRISSSSASSGSSVAWPWAYSSTKLSAAEVSLANLSLTAGLGCGLPASGSGAGPSSECAGGTSTDLPASSCGPFTTSGESSASVLDMMTSGCLQLSQAACCLPACRSVISPTQSDHDRQTGPPPRETY